MELLGKYETRVIDRGLEAPPVGENIMGELLTLIYRYQDVKRTNEEAQGIQAESAARMLVLEKELHAAIEHAYKNDEVTRILVQLANIALNGRERL